MNTDAKKVMTKEIDAGPLGINGHSAMKERALVNTWKYWKQVSKIIKGLEDASK